MTDDLSFKSIAPSNVFIVETNLKELSEKASMALEIPIKIEHAYKLCDFKPLYGLMFNDVIKEYKFWGYGDIDVIFGDIDQFLPKEKLEKHDVISVRHDFLTGYFQIFKNNDLTKNLFKQSSDYIKVFTADKHYCFDETNFRHQAFTDNIPWNEITCEIDSMMHVVSRLAEEGKLSAYFDFHVIEGTPGKLKWTEGKMYYRGKYEILLYHLIKFKKAGYSRRKLRKTTHHFKISPQVIY